jgi:hypothetical protein
VGSDVKGGIDFGKFDESFALTNRLRTDGTDNLLAASRAADVRRFVVQSYAGWTLERGGSATKTEDVPLDPHPVAATRQTMAGIRHLESVVTSDPSIVGLHQGPRRRQLQGEGRVQLAARLRQLARRIPPRPLGVDIPTLSPVAALSQVRGRGRSGLQDRRRR